MKAFLDILKPNQLIYPNTVGYDWNQVDVNRPQGHPYYHWLQTNQGEGVVNIDNKSIILSKNDGILITPFTPHKYQSDQFWTTNFITICGYASIFFQKQLGEKKYFVLRESSCVDKDIYNLTNKLDSSCDDAQISLQTYKIFLDILHGVQQVSAEGYKSIPICWEIKNYIDDNYMEKISIKKIGRLFNISPQYIIKVFKQAFNISPYRYLTKKRISEAEKLLISNKDLLISEVANLVGFDGASHFIDVFKRVENCTPLEFRLIYYQGADFNHE
ncbi:AraC family transcriptional regulator [Pediococcus pentosaceus]|uniref:AraC family transcriptional regulator n=1 Tax=Pediococcus pentosaceus TaxID=1255 RepID=UPI001F561634|nr:AraC family transcriptional regulator [Pediococcus pentosaceus]MCI2959765.1 AraC family transcriptional regulator [Pediococcus pentosaceus]